MAQVFHMNAVVEFMEQAWEQMVFVADLDKAVQKGADYIGPLEIERQHFREIIVNLGEAVGLKLVPDDSDSAEAVLEEEKVKNALKNLQDELNFLESIKKFSANNIHIKAGFDLATGQFETGKYAEALKTIAELNEKLIIIRDRL